MGECVVLLQKMCVLQRKPERQRCRGWRLVGVGVKREMVFKSGLDRFGWLPMGDYARWSTLGPLISGRESHGPRGRGA